MNPNISKSQFNSILITTTKSCVNLSWVYIETNKTYEYATTLLSPNYVGIETRLHEFHLINEVVGSAKVNILFDITCFNHAQYSHQNVMFLIVYCRGHSITS